MSYRVLVTDDVDPDGVALLAAEPALQVDEVATLPEAELLERIGELRRDRRAAAPRRITEALLRRAGTAARGRPRRRGRGQRRHGRGDRPGRRRHQRAGRQHGGRGRAVLRRADLRCCATSRAPTRACTPAAGSAPTCSATSSRGARSASSALGRIGGEVAARAHAFGMPVVGFDPYVSRRALHMHCACGAPPRSKRCSVDTQRAHRAHAAHRRDARHDRPAGARAASGGRHRREPGARRHRGRARAGRGAVERPPARSRARRVRARAAGGGPSACSTRRT